MQNEGGGGLLVSVVMPSKDRYSFVERAVHSIQEQTYKNWELLIVDDSRPEIHRQIQELARIDRRIRIVGRPRGTGPCTARKLGVNASRGIFVTFIDSDDYYLPERIQRHIEAWKSHPEIGLSYDSWSSTDRSETEYLQKQLKHVPPGLCAPPYTARRMFLGNFIHASSAITTKKIIDLLGGYPEDVMVCDWYLNIRICARYPVYRIDRALSVKDSLAPDRLGASEASLVTREFRRGRRMLFYANPRLYAKPLLEEALLSLPISLKNRDGRYLRLKFSHVANTLWA